MLHELSTETSVYEYLDLEVSEGIVDTEKVDWREEIREECIVLAKFSRPVEVAESEEDR